MQGLKILGVKMAQIVSGLAPPFMGKGSVHESVVLGIEWAILFFLFLSFLRLSCFVSLFLCETS